MHDMLFKTIMLKTFITIPQKVSELTLMYTMYPLQVQQNVLQTPTNEQE